MSNSRQDAWNDNHDQILAETVLSHIRNGSTQLAAFEETASKLNRTPAACGFRWNKEIRKHYEVQISEAKLNRVKQRSPRREVVISSTFSVPAYEPETTLSPSNNNWDHFFRFLREQRETMDTLLKYVQQLEKQNEDLKHRLESSRTPEIEANEDYQALMQIMNRARGLGVLKGIDAHV